MCHGQNKGGFPIGHGHPIIAMGFTVIYTLYMRIPSMGWMTIVSRFKSWHSDKIVEIPAANAVSSQLSLSNDVTLHESAEKRV